MKPHRPPPARPRPAGARARRMAARRMERDRGADARLRGLLALSSDWYWEQDAELRFVAAADSPADRAGIRSTVTGQHRWDIPSAGVSEAQWAAHRAQLERHEPFTAFQYLRRSRDGRWRWVSVSGQPMFSRGGRFLGYRGVGRDITPAKLAEQSQALRAACADAMASAPTAAQAIRGVLQAFCETMEWDYGAFLRLDESDGQHVVAHSWHRAELDGSDFLALSSRRREVASEGGLTRRVLATGRPSRVDDIASRPDLRRGPAALAVGLTSAFAFPVGVGGRQPGVLEFFARRLWQPAGALEDLASTVGRQLSEYLVRREVEERYRELVEMLPEAILIQDERSIVFANPAAARLLGADSPAALVGRPASGFVPAAERPGFEAQLRHQRTHRGAIARSEAVWQRLDGSRCEVEFAGSYFVHEDQPAVQLLARDVSDRLQAQREILRRSRLYAALSHTNAAIVRSTDAPTLFQEACRIAVAFGGFACALVMMADPATGHLHVVAGAGDLLGHLQETKSGRPPAPGSPTAQALARGRPSLCGDLRTADAEAGWRERLLAADLRSCASFPLRVEGRVTGVLALYAREADFLDTDLAALLNDMAGNLSHAMDALDTERRRRAAEAALAEKERALSTLLSNLPGMAYRSRGDPHWHFEFVSAGCRQLTGLEPAQVLACPPRWWISLVHPEDRERVGAEIARAVAAHEPYSLEYRLHAGGKARWVLERGQGVYDGSGRLLAREGVVEDVSARALAQQQLAARGAQLQMALETSGQGLWDWNMGTGEVYYDATWMRLLGHPAQPAQAGPGLWRRHLHRDDRHRVLGALRELLRGPDNEAGGEFRVLRCDGQPLWVAAQARVGGRSAAGRPLRLIGTIQNITDRHNAQARLEELAEIDALTGLPNRSLFRDRLGQALARGRRSGHALAVMFVDLDGFKHINDTRGHAAGDAVLRAAAQRLREQVRETDTVSRLGGDEFTLILENVDAEAQVSAVADKIRRAVATAVDLPGGPVSVRASIGIALYPRDGTDGDTLLAHADSAMYAAKRAGGDAFRWRVEDS